MEASSNEGGSVHDTQGELLYVEEIARVHCQGEEVQNAEDGW